MQETASSTPAPEAGEATSTPAPDFESFAAELDASQKPKEEPKAEEPDPPKEEEPKAEGEDDEPAEEEPEAEPEKSETDEAAPTVSKQLAAINRAKARADAQILQAKQQLAHERAELDQVRQRYQGFEQRVQAFEAAQKRAKYDLPWLIKQLGVTDFTEAARQIYHAGAGGEAAIQYQRQSQIEEQVAEVRAENARLRAEIEAERNAAKKEKAISAFLGQAKEFHPRAPLVSQLANNDPDEYREEIEQVAVSLHQKGKPVTAQTVIEAYEQRLQKRAALKPEAKPPTKTQIQNSRETKMAPPAGNDPQRPRPAPSTSSVPDFDEFASQVSRGG